MRGAQQKEGGACMALSTRLRPDNGLAKKHPRKRAYKGSPLHQSQRAAETAWSSELPQVEVLRRIALAAGDPEASRGRPPGPAKSIASVGEAGGAEGTGT